jgi:transposase
VEATDTSQMDLHGIGPSGAAAGRGRRHHPLPNGAHFASWTGTAPIDPSSGDHVRHRLSRGGNRQLNRVLHIMATVQLRNPTDGRAYFDRKKTDGKTSMEAMRCLKRRLSDIVYRHMLDDAVTHTVTSPEGQRGTTTDSSVTGSHPHTGSSDKPLPGPVSTKPKTPLRTAS